MSSGGGDAGIAEAVDITQLLWRWRQGDREALSELMAAVYGQLHRLAIAAMNHERRSHTLQATALVHEAFLRLAGVSQPRWRDRTHFYRVVARMMRRILVDHARHLHAQRRGTGWSRLSLEELDGAASMPPLELLALDQALDQLAALDERKALVIELRFFAGLSVDETAELLSVSKPTVVLDTRLARAWLCARIEGSEHAA